MKPPSLAVPKPPSRLILTILAYCCSVLSAQEICLIPSMNSPTGVSSSNGGGILSPLLDSAQRTRESIFNQELPYDVIRKEISEV